MYDNASRQHMNNRVLTLVAKKASRNESTRKRILVPQTARSSKSVIDKRKVVKKKSTRGRASRESNRLSDGLNAIKRRGIKGGIRGKKTEHLLTQVLASLGEVHIFNQCLVDLGFRT